MASSSKKRTTMAKMNRERAVKEKQAKKQEKRDAKRAARDAMAAGVALADALVLEGEITTNGESETAAAPSATGTL
jgi:hypothetical protein